MKRSNSTLVLIVSLLILSITILALPVNAAIMPSVDISDISKLGTAPTVTATYREVDAENGVFALDFGVANTDFLCIGMYFSFDVNSIVTCQPDGSAATGLKKKAALVPATKTLEGFDSPVAINDSNSGWASFYDLAIDPTNGSFSLNLQKNSSASDDILAAHGVINGVMPASSTPYEIFSLYFKVVGNTTLEDIKSSMITPLSHILQPWNGVTVYTSADNKFDVPITFVGLVDEAETPTTPDEPEVPDTPSDENLLGTPMLGNNIDDIIGEGLGYYDAAQNSAQYFTVTEDGSIPQVRYYFPTDFLDYYNIDEYTFDFKIMLWEREADIFNSPCINEETITATITADDLGWYVFTLSEPFIVYKDTLYGISINKGLAGYFSSVFTTSGKFDDKINSPFVRPTDGFGAWGSDPSIMPVNSYELLGGLFWGVDPVYSPEIPTPETPTVTYEDVPMIGNSMELYIGLGNGTYDAGHHLGQYFKVTQDGYISAVRHYFPKDFLSNYNLEEYTYDFKINLWQKDIQTLVAQETINATITSDDLGWYTFTLSEPFAVSTDTVYCISVYKGCNGYILAGNSNTGDFDGKISAPFERPSDGFGAWNNIDYVMPNNMYTYNGGSFWGVDPVYSSELIEEENPSPFKYRVNQDGTTITITGYTGVLDEGLTIPSSINGYAVTSIGTNAFDNLSNITGTLTIPDTVTSIDSYAFLNCSGLTGTLSLPENLTKIGDSAFSGCSGFTGSLVIPKNVMTIGQYAFYNCSGFSKSVTIPGSVSEIRPFAFCRCINIENAIFLGNAPSRIDFEAFAGTANNFIIYYLKDSSGWTSPTWTSSSGDVYNTMVYTPDGTNVTVSFAGKLCAFMDSLYIRYYFNTDAIPENVDYMGTLLMSKDDYEAGEYTELTLENATINLKAENSADDQYASLGNFALQTVYAKDINTVYKARPYVVLKGGSVYYGDTEEYGLSVYLNNQLNKDTATAIYKKLLNHILEYGNIMQEYINR